MNVLCGLNCRNAQSESMCKTNVIVDPVSDVVPLFGKLLPDILDQTTKLKQSAASFSKVVGGSGPGHSSSFSHSSRSSTTPQCKLDSVILSI